MLIEPHEQHINIPSRSVLFMALPRASLYDPHVDHLITKILQPEKRKDEVHRLLSENITFLLVSEPSCN